MEGVCFTIPVVTDMVAAVAVEGDGIVPLAVVAVDGCTESWGARDWMLVGDTVLCGVAVTVTGSGGSGCGREN